ncbi:MAG: kinase [Planctomycetota bacterium]|nr:MAG: kinase [Planctomycetota bacterium]
MIINRTPLRISFFGGGTDYPSWHTKHGGSVLNTSIDKYCYISCRVLPPFFEHKLRIVYSKTELCSHFEEIQHPAVRETLRFLGLTRGLEIHYDGDLPARSGMGSSSSFTVGLLHVLYALQGIMPSKRQLALESIHIEQNMIKETVGSQDQVSAAYGGLNQINFHTNGEIDVQPVTLSRARMEELDSHLMLFYTGIKRTASNVAKNYVEDICRKKKVLKKMQKMVEEGIEVLNSNFPIYRFGELLHETWMLKRSLGEDVSNGYVDALYERARKAGAIGGKITGAGGGGFLLLFVPPSKQSWIREELSDKIHVPFRFESVGSQIVFYEPDQVDYSELEKDRAKRVISSFKELEAIKKLRKVHTETVAKEKL